MGPDGYNTIFLRKLHTCWAFCIPETEDTAVIDPSDSVLKLPPPLVSGSSYRIVTIIFGVDLSGYNVS
jgi:hypothetical protein